MKKVFVLCVYVLITQVSFAQPALPSSPQKIRILSWNIFMLPGGLAMQNRLRAEAIGNLLADSEYDVVVFQEAFCPVARRKIRKLLSEHFAYQAGPANKKILSLKINSGVWIFSKHPIITAQSITFTHRKGWDALSRKGALLVELDVRGSHVQVIGTHLQNAGDDQIREAQCSEFYSKLLLPRTKDGTPQIICGDFNINKYESANSYQMMLRTLEATDGEIQSEIKFTYDRLNNDLHVEKGINQDLIDYILIRNNGAWVPSFNREVVALKSRWNREHQDLSDHYSMAAEIQFSNYPLMETLLNSSR